MGWPKGKKRGASANASKARPAKVVLKGRCERDLNRQQERFVIEYLVDRDVGAAYVRAGYVAKDDKVAVTAGRRLLRDTRVMSLLNNEEIKRIVRTTLDGDNTVLRLYHLYMEAMRQNELQVAGKMLTELAKIQGLYELHNKQKRNYTMEDIDKLKSELKEAGFDMDKLEPSPN